MKLYIEKSIVIKADVESIHRQVENYRKWNNWSPWYMLDTDTEQTISGQPGAIGHSMSWKSEITGEGKNTIKSISNEQIDFDLHFLKPWKSTAETSFVFKKVNEHETKVVWSMDSSLPFFMFFMKKMMVSMIGQDYERGLLMLQSICETGELKTQSIDKGVSEMKGFEYIGFSNTAVFENMSQTMEKDFIKLMNVSDKEGRQAKEWMTIYTNHSFAKSQISYIAAISAENFPKTPEGMVRGKINDGKVFTVLHEGDYKYLGNSWNKAMMTAKAKKIKMKKYPFERYVNDPMKTQADDLRTEIILPIK